jgi:hypothetical protein
MTRDEERAPGQKPMIHETTAEPEPLDSNESADDAVEVLQPDGTPVEGPSDD